MNTLTFSLSEINTAAKWLIENAQGHSVWLFDGQMGAGKTTLIGEVCRQMGVQNTIQSPTFSIVNEYATTHRGVIYHFDCYRLKNIIEAYDIGIEEYLDSGNYCFIEWPDKIAALLPESTLSVSIAPINETTRQIQLRRQ